MTHPSATAGPEPTDVLSEGARVILHPSERIEQGTRIE